MSTRAQTKLTVLLTSFTLGACAVGPNYERPDMRVSESFENAVQADTDAQWWQSLKDPSLDTLINASMEQGATIRIAGARLLAARAARGVAQSAFWPQLNANLSYTEYEQSLASPGALASLVQAGIAERDGEFYTSSLDAAWELDLAGGLRRQNESAAAAIDAQQAQYEATRLAIVAETASAYFEWTGAHDRIAALQSNIDSLRRSAELTSKKQAIGLTPEIDALRADANWLGAKAQLPGLIAARKASAYRLRALTGMDIDEIRTLLTKSQRPTPSKQLAVGTPADLLMRRPDIIVAERELAAATAAIGIAKARFFPRLRLNASFGFEAIESSALGTSDARNTALVPFVSWPVFQGGRLRAQYNEANANAAAAAANYEQTVLSSLSEVESLLARFDANVQSTAALFAARQSAAKAADIARKLYANGLIEFLDVLIAERSETELADQAIVARTQTLLTQVALFKALGGGWE